MYVDTQQPSRPAVKPTLDNLIAWLEKQPANGRYDYGCAGECLIALWLRNIDQNSRVNAPFEYTVNGASWRMTGFIGIAAGNCKPYSWTYGKALKRARAERG